MKDFFAICVLCAIHCVLSGKLITCI